MWQNHPNKTDLSAINIILNLIQSSLHSNGIPGQPVVTRIGYTRSLARRRAQMITSNKDFYLNSQQQFKTEVTKLNLQQEFTNQVYNSNHRVSTQRKVKPSFKYYTITSDIDEKMSFTSSPQMWSHTASFTERMGPTRRSSPEEEVDQSMTRRFSQNPPAHNLLKMLQPQAWVL